MKVDATAAKVAQGASGNLAWGAHRSTLRLIAHIRMDDGCSKVVRIPASGNVQRLKPAEKNGFEPTVLSLASARR